MTTNDRQIAKLINQRQVMIEYLNSKVSAQDWSDVSKAAVDISGIEREIKTRRDVKNESDFEKAKNEND